MITLSLTLLLILAGDLTLKFLLRRVMGSTAMSLGPFGRVQVVEGRLWLQQVRERSSRLMLWTLWVAAAISLLIASRWIALSPVFAGLLLGGSLGNAVEHSQRGAVSDYVCLRFWPAFNLADLAVAAGAIGIGVELLIALLAVAT